MIAAAFKSRILDVLPAGVYVCDQRGAILHFNQRAVEMWGVTPEIGQTADQILHRHRMLRLDGSVLPPDEYPAKSALLDGIGRDDFEIILERPDGRRMFLSNNCSLLRDESANVIGAINCFLDITERKMTEAQLNYHLHLTQTITEYAGDSLFLLDQHGLVTFVNPAAERAFGWDKHQLLGRVLHEIVHDEAVCDSVCPLRPNAPPIEIHEDQFIHRDGHRIPVSCSRALIVRDGVVSGSALVVQDITERIRTQAALRESDQRFRSIVETAREGIWSVDAEARTTYANARLASMLGYSVPEMLGRKVTDFMDAAHHDAFRTGWRERRVGAQDQFELCLRRRDGAEVWVSCATTELRDQHGTFCGAFAMLTDLTARRQTQQELIRAKESAERANQAKDHFLATLSHELRTPLAPVLMSASALEADTSLPASVREDLTMIRQNVELEARLIDDLLDLTRISRGKLELHFETVDVHAVARRAAQICCSSDIHTKRLNLVFDLAAGGAFVRADPARLQQVFWNLLKNAVKFTPSGGTITLRSRNAPPETHGPRVTPQILLEVIDNGIGIATDALPRIFDAFEQGSRDVTRAFGGLGLGLAIAKAIVELHGGKISAASDGPGGGATFALQLPCAAAPADFDVAAPIPPARARALSILLVEDHEHTSRVLARLLKREQHEVQVAANVNEALSAASNQRFDLLISDLGLPDGSGLDLMKQLSARYRLKGIALSGFGMDEDIRKSRDSGFSAHLTKPVDFGKLQALIHQIST